MMPTANIPSRGHQGYSHAGSSQYPDGNAMRGVQPIQNLHGRENFQAGLPNSVQFNQSVDLHNALLHSIPSFKSEMTIGPTNMQQSPNSGLQGVSNGWIPLQRNQNADGGYQSSNPVNFAPRQLNRNANIAQLAARKAPQQKGANIVNQQFPSDPPGYEQTIRNLSQLAQNDAPPQDLFTAALTRSGKNNPSWTSGGADEGFVSWEAGAKTSDAYQQPPSGAFGNNQWPIPLQRGEGFGSAQAVGLVHSASTHGQKGDEAAQQQGRQGRKKQTIKDYQSPPKKGLGSKGMQQMHWADVEDADMHDEARPTPALKKLAFDVTAPNKILPADSQPGAALLECQCHLKMLMPNHIAGAIIGREGVQIGEILLITRCQMQISACEDYFPGTYDRILIMGGTMRGLEDCIKMVLRHFREVSDPHKKGREDRAFLCKLAVPSSAVSGLIGHCGDKVKQLSEKTGCRINMSPRVKEMQERIVLIYGEFECLLKATVIIAKEIQSDPHLKEHLALKYNVDVPLGAWSGDKAAPSDPCEPLIPPDDAAFYSKRELILYLQAAAPREILLRHCLLGKIENTMKSKGTSDLKGALQETWDLRTMDLCAEAVTIRARPAAPHPQHHNSQVCEVAMPLPPGEVKRNAMTPTQATLFPLPPIKRDRSASPDRNKATEPADEQTPKKGDSSSRSVSVNRVRSSSTNGRSSQNRQSANTTATEEKEATKVESPCDVQATNGRNTGESHRPESNDIGRDTSHIVTPSPEAGAVAVRRRLASIPPRLDRHVLGRNSSRARSLSTGRTGRRGTLDDFKDIERTRQFDQPWRLEAQVQARLGEALREYKFDETDELRFELEDEEHSSELAPCEFPTSNVGDLLGDPITIQDPPEKRSLPNEDFFGVPVEDELMPNVQLHIEMAEAERRYIDVDSTIQSCGEILGRHLAVAAEMRSNAVQSYMALNDAAFRPRELVFEAPSAPARTMSIASLAADIARPRPQHVARERCQLDAEAFVLGWPTQDERLELIMGLSADASSSTVVGVSSQASSSSDDLDTCIVDTESSWLSIFEDLVTVFTRRELDDTDVALDFLIADDVEPELVFPDEDRCDGATPRRSNDDTTWFASLRSVALKWTFLKLDEPDEVLVSTGGSQTREHRGRYCSTFPCDPWARKAPLARIVSFPPDSDSEESSVVDV